MKKATLSILIAGNENVPALRLQRLLKSEGYKNVTTALNTSQALLKAKKVDLLIVEMCADDKWDALELVRQVNEVKLCPVIYLTRLLNETIIAKLHETRPAAVILEPCLIGQISIAIEAAFYKHKERRENEKPETTKEKQLTIIPSRKEAAFSMHGTIYIKERYKFVKITLADILFAEADNNVTSIVTSRRKYLLRKSLQYLMDTIEYEHMVRVHRSFAVNQLHIDSFDEISVLVGNKEIPISKKYKDELMKRVTRV